MVDEGVGIARAADETHREIIGKREVDVAQHLLAVIAAIDEVDFAARGEVGRLADEVDDTADRALAEQHRGGAAHDLHARSEEHTSELQSLMRISYAVFCLKKKKNESTSSTTYTTNTTDK